MKSIKLLSGRRRAGWPRAARKNAPVRKNAPQLKIVNRLPGLPALMPVQLFPSTPSPPPPNGHLLQSLRIIGLAAALIPGMIAVRGATTPPAGAIKLLPDLIQSPRAQKLAFSQQKQLKRLNGGKTRRKRGKPAASHHTSTARPRARAHAHTHTERSGCITKKERKVSPETEARPANKPRKHQSKAEAPRSQPLTRSGSGDRSS